MAKSYLDKDGLLYFWQKIKTYFTGTATPAMDGTAATGTSNKFAREDHVHPSDTTKVDKVTGKGLSTEDYTSAEKTKLAGIAAGAEVNQNAFGNVKVGTTTIAADGKTDTLELVAGSNVTLTPDATNDKVTIAATDTKYTAATAKPAMDGTAAVGTSAKYAREDHVHPSDTSRVPTTRTVNGKALSADITLSAFNVGAVPSEDLLATHIDGCAFEPGEHIIHFATCSTAAGTAAKTIEIPTGEGFVYTLTAGAIVYVKFSATNTAAVANLTLKVNLCDAKPIKYRGGNLPSAGTLAAKRVYAFVYDGTNWELVGDLDTNTTYTAASATPKMDGTAAVGSSSKYAREDHVHPTDTSRVPTTRTVNGKALSANITLSASDVNAVPNSAIGTANGVCPLNASSKIDATYLPSYVDDVIEAYARSGQTALSSTWLATGSATGTVITPETGKIYILMADSGDYAANTQFRWSGTTYVKMADGGVSSITNSEIDTILAS